MTVTLPAEARPMPEQVFSIAESIQQLPRFGK